MELLTQVTEREWREFLAQVDGASIFQSPEMMRVYAATKGYRPLVSSLEANGAIRALMAAAVISYTPGWPSSLSSRVVCFGGPLGQQRDFPKLLAAHDAVASKLALVSQIRNLQSPLDLKVFERAGYAWEDHVNFLIDLRLGEEVLLSGMSKARRRGIGSADRVGLEVRALLSADLAEAYKLVQNTYARADVPLADVSLFRNAFDILAPRGELWAVAAFHSGSPRAVRLVLRWGDTLYDWYAGSSEEGRRTHADEWLVWQVLRRGIEAGCSMFDFGGAGRPEEPYGPREFKRRFGGTMIAPGRFVKAYHPIAVKLSNIAYDAWRKL